VSVIHIKQTVKEGLMKKVIVLACMLILMTVTAGSAGSKNYALDGTVTDIKENVFTIQKDNVKYEMTRDADAMVNGELKVGSKVTVIYKMTATKIVVKEDKK
jgi:hypothetical protein